MREEDKKPSKRRKRARLRGGDKLIDSRFERRQAVGFLKRRRNDKAAFNIKQVVVMHRLSFIYV